jgi:hypothetical protein
MPFVKLDTGILDSSLWMEDPVTRLTLITMLAMCNPEGLCPATAPGIARRGNLPLSSVRRSLKKLESPDPDDRSGVDKGRRIKRVAGGYVVTNYLRYREKDYTAAERMRRYRQRQNGAPVTRDDRHVTRNVTQGRREKGEAEAEVETRNGAVPSRRSPDMKPETATAIEDTARQLAGLVPTVTAAEWITRGSNIEAGDGRAAASFSDPRRRGLTEAWGEKTLARLRESLAGARTPVPL